MLIDKEREKSFHYVTDNGLLEDVIRELWSALETAHKRIAELEKDVRSMRALRRTK